jgi:hypothetical protein
VQTTYHFLRLFIYRTYLLSSFLDHLPGTTRSPFTDADLVPEEVKRCVEAAVAIAELATGFQSSSRGGTFWVSGRLQTFVYYSLLTAVSHRIHRTL